MNKKFPKLSKLLLNQKIRYLLTGSYNTMLGYLVFVLIFYFYSSTVSHSLLLGICYLISTTHNFFSYRTFVFKIKDISLINYFKFNLVYLFTFMLNLSMFMALTKGMNMNLYLSQAFIVIVIAVVGYILNKYFSFSNKLLFNLRKE
jgi:putative flippase GtrA